MPKKEKKQRVSKKINEYSTTAKVAKELVDEKNKSQLAQVYRAVAEYAPAEFDAIFKATAKMRSGMKEDYADFIVRHKLYELKKAGFVKVAKIDNPKVVSIATRAAGKRSAPKGVRKPRPARKPREKSAPDAPPASGEPSQAASA
jgi:hypothetical protein